MPQNAAVAHQVYYIKSCVLPKARLKFEIQNVQGFRLRAKNAKNIFKVVAMFSSSPFCMHQS